ncbi:Hypothetical_protein [Hexamita inflata]|uniref:Hypothetical_protein n=1 Tax=Hexamita inflata TaxID=28002 RepID=A0AA86V057_9EUKA|nr:Hypothetical protein HINF_LOCUS58891 [Hexamita inflata]
MDIQIPIVKLWEMYFKLSKENQSLEEQIAQKQTVQLKIDQDNSSDLISIMKQLEKEVQINNNYRNESQQVQSNSQQQNKLVLASGQNMQSSYISQISYIRNQLYVPESLKQFNQITQLFQLFQQQIQSVLKKTCVQLDLIDHKISKQKQQQFDIRKQLSEQNKNNTQLQSNIQLLNTQLSNIKSQLQIEQQKTHQFEMNEVKQEQEVYKLLKLISVYFSSCFKRYTQQMLQHIQKQFEQINQRESNILNQINQFKKEKNETITDLMFENGLKEDKQIQCVQHQIEKFESGIQCVLEDNHEMEQIANEQTSQILSQLQEQYKVQNETNQQQVDLLLTQLQKQADAFNTLKQESDNSELKFANIQFEVNSLKENFEEQVNSILELKNVSSALKLTNEQLNSVNNDLTEQINQFRIENQQIQQNNEIKQQELTRKINEILVIRQQLTKNIINNYKVSENTCNLNKQQIQQLNDEKIKLIEQIDNIEANLNSLTYQSEMEIMQKNTQIEDLKQAHQLEIEKMTLHEQEQQLEYQNQNAILLQQINNQIIMINEEQEQITLLQQLLQQQTNKQQDTITGYENLIVNLKQQENQLTLESIDINTFILDIQQVCEQQQDIETEVEHFKQYLITYNSDSFQQFNSQITKFEQNLQNNLIIINNQFETINQNQNTIQILDGTIKQLEQDKENIQHESISLQQQLKQLQQQLDNQHLTYQQSLEQQIQQQKQEIQEITTQINNQNQKKFNQVEEQNSKLINSVNELKLIQQQAYEQISDLNNINMQLKQELSKKGSKDKDKQKAVPAQVPTQDIQAKQQIIQMQTSEQVQLVQQKLDNCKDEIVQLNKQILTMETTVQQLKQENNQQFETIQQLTEKLNAESKIEADVSTQSTKLIFKENARLKQLLEQNTDYESSFKKQLLLKDEHINQLTQQKQQFENDSRTKLQGYQKLTETYRRFQINYDDIKIQNESLQNKHDIQKTELENCQRQLSELEFNLQSEYMIKQNNMQQEIENIKQSHKQQFTQQQKESEMLIKRIMQVKEQNLQLQSKIQQLESGKKQKKDAPIVEPNNTKDIEELTQQLNLSKKHTEELENMITSLKNELKDQLNIYERLVKTNQQQITKSKSDIKQFEIEAAEMKKKLTTVTQQLTEREQFVQQINEKVEKERLQIFAAEDLKIQFEQLKFKQEESQQTIQVQREQIDNLHLKVQQLNTQLFEVQDQNESKIENIEQSEQNDQQELKNNQIEHQKLTNTIKQLELQIVELQSVNEKNKIEQLEQIAKLQEQIDQQQKIAINDNLTVLQTSQITQTQSMLDTTQNTCETSMSNENLYIDQIHTLKQQILEYNQVINTYKQSEQTITQLQEELQLLKNQFSSNNINVNQKDVNQQDSTNSEVKEDQTIIQSSLSTIQQSVLQLQLELDQLNNESELKINELNKLLINRTEKQTLNIQTEQQIQDLQEYNKQLQEQSKIQLQQYLQYKQYSETTINDLEVVLNERKSESELQVVNLQQEIRKLNEEIDIQEHTCRQQVKQIDDQASQIDTMKLQNSNDAKTIQKMKLKENELHEEIEDLKERILMAQEQNQNNMVQTTAFDNQFDSYKVKQYEAEIQQLKEDQQKHVKQIQQQLQEIETVQRNSKTQLQEKDTEIEQLKSLVEKNQQDKQSNDQMPQEVQSKEKTISKELVEKVDQFQSSVQEQDREIQKLEEQENNQLQQIQQLKDKLSQLQVDFQQQLEQKNATIKQLELQALESQRNNNNTDVKEYQDKIEALEKELAQTQLQNSERSTKLHRLETAETQHKQLISKLESELSSSKEQHQLVQMSQMSKMATLDSSSAKELSYQDLADQTWKQSIRIKQLEQQIVKGFDVGSMDAQTLDAMHAQLTSQQAKLKSAVAYPQTIGEVHQFKLQFDNDLSWVQLAQQIKCDWNAKSSKQLFQTVKAMAQQLVDHLKYSQNAVVLQSAFRFKYSIVVVYVQEINFLQCYPSVDKI